MSLVKHAFWVLSLEAYAEVSTELTFFLVVMTQDLRDRVAKAKDWSEEMFKIRKEIVDFHGEMVLLENYSALNYTGITFILFSFTVPIRFSIRRRIIE